MLERLNVVVIDGGCGRRMHPFTRFFPKSMLPYEEGTVLDAIVSTYMSMGSALTVISGFNAGIISAYLSNHSAIKPWTVVREEVPKGSVGCLADLVGVCSEQILAVNFCDSIVQFDLEAAVYEFVARRAAMMVFGERRTIISDFGLIEIDDDGRVMSFKEKRVESIIRNCGVFFIKNDVLRAIKDHSLSDMEALIRHLHSSKRSVVAFLVEEGKRVNTGDWSSYATAICRLRESETSGCAPFGLD